MILSSISANGSVMDPDPVPVASVSSDDKMAKACTAFGPNLPAVPIPEPPASNLALTNLIENLRTSTADAFNVKSASYEDFTDKVAEHLRDQQAGPECDRPGSVSCYVAPSDGRERPVANPKQSSAPKVFERIPNVGVQAFGHPPAIESAYRPAIFLGRDPRKVFEADELHFGARHFRTFEEAEAFRRSPDYQEGLYSGLVVRDRFDEAAEGIDSLILIRRVADDPMDIAKAHWAGHRAAELLMINSNGGHRPLVVGGFETLLGFMGEQIKTVNSAGTYPYGNVDVRYSADVMHAFGFTKDSRTILELMKPEQNDLDFGHMRAKETAGHLATLERLYPGAVGEFRIFLKQLFERYPELRSEERTPAGKKFVSFATARTISRSAEQMTAYREIMEIVQHSRESSLGIVYLFARRPRQNGTLEEAAERARGAVVDRTRSLNSSYIPEEPNSPEAQKITRVRKYLFYFLNEFLSLP